MAGVDLHLALLGRPIINLGDSSLRDAVPQKMQALLCYLVMNPGNHNREIIASLLWGESTTHHSRTSLRTDLARASHLLSGLLHITRTTVAFNQQSNYWLDVMAFTDYLADTPTAEQARRAVALYRGEFLEGFFVNNAPDFEDWQLGQRERLRELALQGLALLVTFSLKQKDYQEGIGYAQQLLRLDPWREEAHRELMRLLALSGQRSAALEQFASCQAILAEEFGVAPGRETVLLAEQIRADLLRPHPTPSPPLPIQQPAPFLPPPDLPHFVGREQVVKQIIAAATSPHSPNRLALIGMGGMGKTSLAIHLAHQLRDQFPDGVLWADVSQDDLIGLIDRWAEAYNCDFRTVADEASRAAALRDILKEKKALLILDDVDRVTKVRPLLPDHFPGKIIITTRSEEIAYHLKAAPYPLQELDTAAGLALLRQVVGEERVQAESAAANQLCNLLQNLPLALNIAAQRLALRHQMHLRDMVARLQREKSRLTALDEQDQAVRASFLVSWRALDEKQKRTFALLGLFGGRSFTVEAVTAIAAADPYETEDVLFALNALSLVNQTAENRYRQHTLLAEFAHEQLADPQADRRLADYFLTFAQAHGQAYEALRPEWENVMAGMETAHKREMWAEVLGYSEALTEAWFARGRYTEARRGYEWAVAAAAAIPAPTRQGQNLLLWAKACLEQSDNQQAEQLINQSLALAKQQHDLASQAMAQNVKASLLLESIQTEQDYQAIAALLDSSYDLYTQTGNVAGQAETLHLQARVCYLQSAYDQAEQFARQALQQRQQIGDNKGQIVSLRLLALIVIGKQPQDWPLSLQYREQAVQLSQATNDQGEEAISLSMLATGLLTQGELTQAERLLQQSLTILRQIGARRGIVMTLLALCQARHKQKAITEAWQLGEESLQMGRLLADPLILLNLFWELGNLAAATDDLTRASNFFYEGWQTARHINQARWSAAFQHKFEQLTPMNREQ